MSGRDPVKSPASYLQTDNIRMTAAHITWSADEMSMKEFVSAVDRTMANNICNDVRNESPIMCRVETGYHGCDLMHEFSTDETYWVRKIDRQKRLVVMDTRGRYLSIPINYYRKFIALNVRGQKYSNSSLELSLLKDSIMTGDVTELQVENDHPVLVNVGSHGSSGSDERLGTLRVIEFYEEKYIVAHSVADGYVYCIATSIPVYVPIAMSIATGFTPQKSVLTEFAKWMTETDKIVSKLPVSNAEMCQEILLFDEKPCNDYEYLTPAAFVIDRQRHDGDYEEISLVGHELERNTSRFQPRARRYDAFGFQRVELPPLLCASTVVRNVVVCNAYDDLASSSETPPPLPPPPIPVRNKRSMSAENDATQPTRTVRPDGLPPRSQSFKPSRRPAPAVPDGSDDDSSSYCRLGMDLGAITTTTSRAYEHLVLKKRQDSGENCADYGDQLATFRIDNDS